MQFCKGDAAEILYRCEKCSLVAFRGVCGARGVTVQTCSLDDRLGKQCNHEGGMGHP
jgi:hypothetical protein